MVYLILALLLISTASAEVTDLFGLEDTTSTTDTATSKAVVPYSNVKVTFLSQDPDPVEPGEYVELRFRVENFESVAFMLLDAAYIRKYAKADKADML